MADRSNTTPAQRTIMKRIASSPRQVFVCNRSRELTHESPQREAIPVIACEALLPCGTVVRLPDSPPGAKEPASAPGTPTADAPSYKVGDTWTFIWGRPDSRPGTPLVMTVAAVTETQTTMSSSWNVRPPKGRPLRQSGKPDARWQRNYVQARQWNPELSILSWHGNNADGSPPADVPGFPSNNSGDCHAVHLRKH